MRCRAVERFFHLARRFCFRQQYYTGTRRYYSARVECRQHWGETIYAFGSVFRPYLGINVLVWARAVCGSRYGHGASFGCNGVPRTIHTGKIGPPQGPDHDGDAVRFPAPRPLDAAKRTFQGPWVCAAAQLKDSTWLEELVSESNTIQA